MVSLPEAVRQSVHDLVLDHFRGIPSGSSVDLYDSMKTLSWRILLAIFLSTPGQKQSDQSEKDAAEIESLQEGLLRGQFSLFPVSVNARIWRSPRSKGLEARKKLESIFASLVIRGSTHCPFVTPSNEDKEGVASHLLLFTSSLAAKALASFLTAVILNLYIFGESAKALATTSIASGMLIDHNETERIELLKSIVRETERLSPPVVGIMRRATEDIVLQATEKEASNPATLVPKNWDLWLYFVGAARDPAIFGETADSFWPTRYSDRVGPDTAPEGFAFGAGMKSCLGKDLMREVAMTVAQVCLGRGGSERSSGSLPQSMITFSGEGSKLPRGVQGWLGWQSEVLPEEWARDMKQLPTQRPLKPAMVEITHGLNGA